MEVNRIQLRNLLTRVMEDAGEEPNLYYQPPESIQLKYPCIIYQLKGLDSTYANDNPYIQKVSFEATYITRSSTSSVITNLGKLSCSKFDRYFVTDNLHHYVYTFSNTLKEE